MARKKSETKSAFARRMGVSRQRVGQWAKAGLPLDTSDRVKIDPALSWLRNRAPKVGRYQDRGIHLVATEADDSDGTEDKGEQASQPSDAGVLYTRARAAKMAQDAKRAKTDAERAALELRARTGELIEVEGVKVTAFNRARIVRDGMLNLPDRLSAVLAGENDEAKVHELLTAEIRQALEELSGGATAGG